MARKQVVTKEGLLKGAFELVRDNGREGLSARLLAEKCGCSTQPIFRIYDNMGELYHELFSVCTDYFSDFYKKAPKGNETPFVNLGMAYIDFARQYPNLFKIIFIEENSSGKSMYDLVNGGEGNFVIHEIRKLKEIPAEDASLIFMKMWIFIHGIACMVLKDDFDMTEDEIRQLLEATFSAFSDNGGECKDEA